MLAKDIPLRTPFRFATEPDKVWISVGNGWYASPLGYDGGPWHNDTRQVIKVPTNITPEEVDSTTDEVLAKTHADKLGQPGMDGDIAILEYAASMRGLVHQPSSTAPLRVRTPAELST